MHPIGCVVAVAAVVAVAFVVPRRAGAGQCTTYWSGYHRVFYASRGHLPVYGVSGSEAQYAEGGRSPFPSALPCSSGKVVRSLSEHLRSGALRQVGRAASDTGVPSQLSDGHVNGGRRFAFSRSELERLEGIVAYLILLFDAGRIGNLRDEYRAGRLKFSSGCGTVSAVDVFCRDCSKLSKRPDGCVVCASGVEFRLKSC